MAGPHPSTAAIRYAVRSALAEFAPSTEAPLVLVACSGGADSLALAVELAHEAPRAGVRAGAVVVDHGLQAESAAVASMVADWLGALALDPVRVVAASVTPGPDGLEAAARQARYAALETAAIDAGAVAVLLGHTLDDQAEQVLLGLVRGSGLRSLAGMPPARGRYRRPLLGITRRQCRQSLEDQDIHWWEDPMNEDPAFTRVRARRAVADLERDLGPGVAAALARTAGQARADAGLLDALADEAVTALGGGPWPVAALAAYPTPIRTRIWRRLLIDAGAPAGQVSARHTDACDALVTQWRGQGPAHVPGNLRVHRRGAEVAVTPGKPER